MDWQNVGVRNVAGGEGGHANWVTRGMRDPDKLVIEQFPHGACEVRAALLKFAAEYRRPGSWMLAPDLSLQRFSVLTGRHGEGTAPDLLSTRHWGQIRCGARCPRVGTKEPAGPRICGSNTCGSSQEMGPIPGRSRFPRRACFWRFPALPGTTRRWGTIRPVQYLFRNVLDPDLAVWPRTEHDVGETSAPSDGTPTIPGPQSKPPSND